MDGYIFDIDRNHKTFWKTDSKILYLTQIIVIMVFAYCVIILIKPELVIWIPTLNAVYTNSIYS